jgi:transposase-like protein
MTTTEYRNLVANSQAAFRRVFTAYIKTPTEANWQVVEAARQSYLDARSATYERANRTARESKVDVIEAMRLYSEEGKTIREIARLYGVSHQRVYSKFNRAFPFYPRQVRSRSRGWAERFDIAVSRYQEGRTLRDAAQEVGASTTTLRTYMVANGIERRPPGCVDVIHGKRFTEEEKAEICHLYKQGYGQVQLAKRFNCAYPTIRKLLVKSGVPLHRRGYVPKTDS